VNLIDRSRIERAVFTYDSWLEAHGVRTKRRRDLRRELRANLFDATDEQGARQAVEALGSLRSMASEAGGADGTHPRWSAGAVAAVMAFGLVSALGLLAGVWWADGARAVGPNQAVSGSLSLFPGSMVGYESLADEGFSFEVSLGPAPFVVAALAFVLMSRPWRLLTKRAERPSESLGNYL